MNNCSNHYYEEKLKQAAQQLANEIDWDVLANIYKKNGWTEIHFTLPVNEFTLCQEISNWMRLTLTGHYINRQTRWLFEKEKDAIMFALRWSNV